MTREGGCLCSAVRYAVKGPLREVIVCHCVECRRWTGRAWPATAVRLANLEIVESGDLHWLPSPDSASEADRGFCARCGTSLFWRARGSERMSISAGTLDQPSELPIAAHIWVEQGLEWERPPDGVPAYPGGYPPAEAPFLAWH
jgi:hypothetical protein